MNYKAARARRALIKDYANHDRSVEKYFEIRATQLSLLLFSLRKRKVLKRPFSISRIESTPDISELLSSSQWSLFRARQTALSFEIPRLTVARVKMPVLETTPLGADRLVSAFQLNFNERRSPEARTDRRRSFTNRPLVLRDYTGAPWARSQPYLRAKIPSEHGVPREPSHAIARANRKFTCENNRMR